MRVTASAAISADGFLDDSSPGRLILSSAEDWSEVLALRADCDAILVGAGTIRTDNPSLATKTEALLVRRREKGRPAHPTKVTITASGDLDPAARFFHDGDGEKLVFCPASSEPCLAARIGQLATVIPLAPEQPLLPALIDVLSRRGIERLLIEGGRTILTGFLVQGLVDELRLAIAPFFVGEPDAPRFLAPLPLPHDHHNRMGVDRVQVLGDMVVIWYRLKRIDPE